MNTSITETVLLVASTVVSLAVACWLARLPRRPGAGIALGTFAGTVLAFTTSAAVGILAYLLPFGQIDFWIASLFAG